MKSAVALTPVECDDPRSSRPGNIRSGRRPKANSLKRKLASRIGDFARAVRAFVVDLRRAGKEQGLSGAWSEFREWIIYPVFRHGRVVVMEQDLDTLRNDPPPAGVEIRRFSGPDWSALGEIANERTRARFRRAAARGRICFVAWRGEHPIGYVWMSERTEPDLELYPLPLPPDAVYGWDVFVIPAERGRRIGPALVSARMQYAREQGFRSSWRVIAPDNTASFRAVQKTSREDIRVLGELWYVRVLGQVYAQGRLRPSSRVDP